MARQRRELDDQLADLFTMARGSRTNSMTTPAMAPVDSNMIADNAILTDHLSRGAVTLETLAPEVDEVFGDLEGALTDNREAQKELKNDLTNLAEVRLPQLRADLEEAQTRITETVNNRINPIDAGIAILEQTKAEHSAAIKNLKEIALPALAEDLEAAEGRLETNAGRLTSLFEEVQVTIPKAITDRANSTLAYALGAAPRGNNVVVNGSFDQDFTGWDKEVTQTNSNFGIDTTVSRTGGRSFWTVGKGGFRQQSIPVTTGQTWEFSLWYLTEPEYSNSNAGGLRLQAIVNGTWIDVSSSTLKSSSADWSRSVTRYVVPAGVTQIRARFAFNYTGGAKCWVDDIALVDVTAELAAAADATAKADAAKAAAITAADTAARATAKAEAEAAESRAAATAAADAKSQADAAQAAALAAAKTYAESQASGASAAALEAAKTDAQNKADAAKQAAIDAASADATAKKEQAESNAAKEAQRLAAKALDDAKADATSKANAVRTEAMAAAETAAQAARNAAGLAGTMGRTWFQGQAPASGVTYEWAGAPYKSESIRRVDGAETFRNFATHGTFKERGAQQISSAGNGTNAVVNYIEDPALGTRALQIISGGSGYSLVGVALNSASLIAHRGKDLRINAKIWSNTTARNMCVTLREPNTISTFKTTQAEVWETLDMVRAVPALAVTSQVGQESSMRQAGDELRFAQVMLVDAGYTGPYFDGDTPDDRANDLWIDTANGNTPKRWDGTGWVAVTDTAAIEAAKDAASKDATVKADKALSDAKADTKSKTDALRTEALAAAAAAEAAAKRALAAAVNVVVDPGVEDPSAWTLPTGGRTFSFTTAEKYSGTQSLQIVAKAGAASQSLWVTPTRVPAKPGETWRFTAMYKTTDDYNGTGSNGKLRMGNVNGSIVTAWTFTKTAEWKQVGGEFTLPANSGITGIIGQIATDHSAGTLWVDDLVFTNVTEVKASQAALEAAKTAVLKTASEDAQAKADKALADAKTDAGILVDAAKKVALDAAKAASDEAAEAAAALAVAEAARARAEVANAAAITAARTYAEQQASGASDIALEAAKKHADEAALAAQSAAVTAAEKDAKLKVELAESNAAKEAARLANEASAAAQAEAVRLAEATTITKMNQVANSKNATFYGTAAPTATNPKGSLAGDTYRRRNSAGNIIGEWEWVVNTSGVGSWTQRKMTSESMTAIDVGVLTAGTAIINDAVARNIAAGTASFQTVDIGNLTVTGESKFKDLIAEKMAAPLAEFIKLDIGTGTFGELDGGRIKANTVSTKHLLVGSFDNLLENPSFEYGAAGWDGISGVWSVQSTGGVSMPGLLRCKGITARTFGPQSNLIPLETGGDKDVEKNNSGAKFRISGWVKTNATVGTPTGELCLYSYDAAGKFITGANRNFNLTKLVPNTWQYFSTVMEAPNANAVFVKLRVNATLSHVDQEMLFDDLAVVRAVDGSVIVNGSVNADAVDAESVGAAVGTFVKLDVGNLTATGSSKLNDLTAETIGADVGKFISLSTDQLVAGKAQMKEAVANKLFGDVVAGRKFYAEQVVVATPGNIMPDVGFNDPEMLKRRNTNSTCNVALSSANNLALTNNGTSLLYLRPFGTPQNQAGVLDGGWIPVTPGEVWEFKFKASAWKGTTGWTQFVGRTIDGSAYANPGQRTMITTASQDVSVIATIPENCAWIIPEVAVAPGGISYINRNTMVLRQLTDANLLVEGAVTAKHLAANSITADKLRVQGSNAVPDPNFMDDALNVERTNASSAPNNTLSYVTDNESAARVVNFSETSTTQRNFRIGGLNDHIPVTLGDRVRVSVKFRALGTSQTGSSNIRFALNMDSATKSYLRVVGVGSYQEITKGGNTWYVHEADYVITQPDVKFIRPILQFRNAGFTGALQMKEPRVEVASKLSVAAPADSSGTMLEATLGMLPDSTVPGLSFNRYSPWGALLGYAPATISSDGGSNLKLYSGRLGGNAFGYQPSELTISQTGIDLNAGLNSGIFKADARDITLNAQGAIKVSQGGMSERLLPMGVLWHWRSFARYELVNTTFATINMPDVPAMSTVKATVILRGAPNVANQFLQVSASMDGVGFGEATHYSPQAWLGTTVSQTFYLRNTRTTAGPGVFRFTGTTAVPSGSTYVVSASTSTVPSAEIIIEHIGGH